MMRNGKGKKVVSLLLAAVMAFSLAACGNKGSKDNPNGEMAKQYVFSWEELPIPMDGDDYSVQSVSYVNDRIYVITDFYYSDSGAIQEKQENLEEEPSEEEGTVETGEASEEGGTAETGESLDASADASVSGIAVAVPEPGILIDAPATNAEYSEPIDVLTLISFKQDGSDVQSVELKKEDVKEAEYTWYDRLTVGEDGNVYGVKDYYISDTSDPDNVVSEEHMELVCFSGADGSQKWSLSLKEDSSPDEYVYPDSIAVMGDGRIAVVLEGSSNRILIVGTDGKIEKKEEVDSEIFSNISQCFVNTDGILTLFTWNDEWTKMSFCTYNLNTGETSEKKELPANVNSYNLYPSQEGSVMLTNSIGIFMYNMETDSIDQVMSYVNSDLPVGSVQNIHFIDNEHFLGTFYSEGDNRTVVGLFTKVDPKDIPDKIVLVLGCSYLDGNFRKRIVDFNKANEKYRIMIKDYSEYATAEDYMASYTQLNNDILSGNMPDILVVDRNMPIDSYISKGLIADVGKLIEEDEELSKKEFMQNVFDAFSTDGVLHYIVPSFSISTMVAKKSLVGDRSGWNMEEFEEVLSQLPEGISAFGDMTREGYLRSMMFYGGSEYVDLASGKCSFDSPDFIGALEYAGTLPEEIVYGDNFDWTSYENQYRENRTLLMSMYIYDLRGIQRNVYSNFGEEVSFVGFPTESRNGSYIESDGMLVLSAKSTDLAGAWEFARYYLTDEYQQDLVNMNSSGFGFPVNKEMFMTLAQEVTERPYYLDEGGNRVYYDETSWINDEEVIIPPMTQEEMNKTVSFIESVNRSLYYDDEILNIINEEAAPFFDGQKSAEEVADIIQRRVNIYVNER